MALFFGNCSGQDLQNSDKPLFIKDPVYAGQFYPGTKKELENLLKSYFEMNRDLEKYPVHGMIVPHAGYVYSGPVAASGYASIDRGIKYDNVFLIASSHNVSFEGAAVYLKGDFSTPTGIIHVNREISKELAGHNGSIVDMSSAFTKEHSIEVHLPFIQYMFQENTPVVPLIVGTQSPKVCRQIAELLKPYTKGNNLFIISSDFSHYPDYEDAVKADKETAEVILKRSPKDLITYIATEGNKEVPGLVTSLCGWSSVLTYLYAVEEIEGLQAKKVLYRNSGDADIGSKDRVVGYNSIIFYGNKYPQESGFTINDSDRRQLLQLARTTIEQYVKFKKIADVDEKDFSETLKTKCGVFVSLHEEGNLRGCIGTFSPDKPLYQAVVSMAIASSTQDSRFIPVSTGEIDGLEIEISVLTPMKKIGSIDEIILGKHGIYIKKGYNSGTFLPQVATETGWTLEEFLGHCAKDKAGIRWDGWKEADIYTYEAIVFSEAQMK